jgi:hypothetical protein
LLRDEISMTEAQDSLVRLLRANVLDLVQHALAIGRFRDGVDALFAAAHEGRLDLVVPPRGSTCILIRFSGNGVRAYAVCSAGW